MPYAAVLHLYFPVRPSDRAIPSTRAWWLLSSMHFVVHFVWRPSHCPCQIQRCWAFCLEVTSAPNTPRELPMGFGWRHFLYPQKRVTQTSKPDHFSKRVNMFNCHSCVFCACTSVYMTVNTRALCHLYQLYFKFWLVFFSSLIVWLVISLIHPRRNAIILSASYFDMNTGLWP
jgi:hypothetical protein